MENIQGFPISTMIGLWVGLVVTVVLPLATVLFLGIKKKGTITASLLGILSYGAGFAVYGLLWCVYVAIFSNGYNTVGLTWDFYLVLAIMAGIIATLVNYLFLGKVIKKNDSPIRALSFFAGYGLTVCYQGIVSLFEDIYWTTKYNSMGIEALNKSLGDDADRILDLLYNVSMHGTLYFTKALETILYMACYVAIGYILYQAVKKEKKWHMIAMVFAMIFQFGIVLPAQLIKSEAIDVAGMEMILAVVTILAILAAGIIMYKKNSKTTEGN